ncbi:hypothetical protein O3P69_002723 [Scylla paramamosain]|uniref:Uncharacterized protein n=1 Tax=Scylla paramamosain TaxID=85552 RepID=A0AAW0UR93_SCYPA
MKSIAVSRSSRCCLRGSADARQHHTINQYVHAEHSPHDGSNSDRHTMTQHRTKDQLFRSLTTLRMGSATLFSPDTRSMPEGKISEPHDIPC